MSFTSWMQNHRSALSPGRGRRQSRRRGSLRTATHRPNLETLEVRSLLSFMWGGSFPDGSYPGPVVTDHSAAVGDFTTDGIPDQVTNGLDTGLYLRAGLGDGTFADPILTAAPPTRGSLAAADFNGDGRLDVVTFGVNGSTGDAADSALVLLGRGDGTFVWPFHYENVGVSPATGIDTWDFNGDGRPDLEVAGYDFWDGSPVTTVLVNNGDWGSVLPNLRINDATVAEGNTGTASATFTVTLSAAWTRTITVDYGTSDATATAGSDYQAASGTLTFAPGETSKTITVLVNGDRVPEPNETFVVNLSSPTNATVVAGQGVGTIMDDEPRISIGDVTKTEGKKGQTTLFTFTVTLSAAYDQPVTMSFRTADGTAKTSDGDYVARTGTLTFAAGETSKTITIVVQGDSKRESDETFYLDLFGNSSNSLFTKKRGLGTIRNDD